MTDIFDRFYNPREDNSDIFSGEFYMDKMSSYLDLSKDEILAHANKFRGDMFELDENGDYKLKDPIWEIEPIKGDYSVKGIMSKLDY